MIVHIYEYHYCDRNRAVEQNKLKDCSWCTCATTIRINKQFFMRLVRYIAKHAVPGSTVYIPRNEKLGGEEVAAIKCYVRG